jgi:hypothetical protein
MKKRYRPIRRHPARDALASAECSHSWPCVSGSPMPKEQADARQAEQQGLELARRQAVYCGFWRRRRPRGAEHARAASADARERVEMLADRGRDPERDVLEAEHDLLAAMSAPGSSGSHREAELVAAILRSAPPSRPRDPAAWHGGPPWEDAGRLGEHDSARSGSSPRRRPA